MGLYYCCRALGLHALEPQVEASYGLGFVVVAIDAKNRHAHGDGSICRGLRKMSSMGLNESSPPAGNREVLFETLLCGIDGA